MKRNKRVVFFPSIIFFMLLAVLSSCGTHDKTAEDYFQKRDYKKAYELFKPRAMNGEADAQAYVGLMHYLGVVGSRDLEKAALWLEKAAKQKHPGAQLNYALVLEEVAKESKDYVNAYKWYYVAFENGNQAAEKHMKYIVKHRRIFHNQRAYAQKQMEPYIDYEKAKAALEAKDK